MCQGVFPPLYTDPMSLPMSTPCHGITTTLPWWYSHPSFFLLPPLLFFLPLPPSSFLLRCYFFLLLRTSSFLLCPLGVLPAMQARRGVQLPVQASQHSRGPPDAVVRWARAVHRIHPLPPLLLARQYPMARAAAVPDDGGALE